MNAEYKFQYDEQFVAESLRRYRRHHPMRIFRWILKGVGVIGLGALLAVGVLSDSAPMIGIFSFFIALLIVGPVVDIWWAKRWVRKSPFYNSSMMVRFSDSGYLAEGSNSRTELSWAVFTEGARLPDGFLLFTGPQQYYWLPDSALCAGDIVDVEAVLKQKILKFRAAER